MIISDDSLEYFYGHLPIALINLFIFCFFSLISSITIKAAALFFLFIGVSFMN